MSKLTPNLILLSAAAMVASPLAANAQRALGQHSLDGAYECARAFEVGEAGNRSYDFGSKRAWGLFEKLLSQNIGTEETAKANVTKVWEAYQAQNGQDALVAYAWQTATDCDAAMIYAEADENVAAASEPPRDLTTADLRYHVTQTGDYAIVADYVVGLFPYGKKLTEEIPEGNLLGELVAETGAKGVMKFSDAAVFAMATQYYWQYNPPATRIIFSEYQRRLRVRKYTETEGQRWAKRAADERAANAQSSSPRAITGSRAVSRKGSCRTVPDYAGGGTKAICNQY